MIPALIIAAIMAFLVLNEFWVAGKLSPRFAMPALMGAIIWTVLAIIVVGGFVLMGLYPTRLSVTQENAAAAQWALAAVFAILWIGGLQTARGVRNLPLGDGA